MKTTKNLNIWLAMSMFLLSMVSTAVAQTIYVDDEATGANNGSSWAGAYNYLQDALAVAVYGDEIWVAQGIYIPDSNSANPNGSGDREATFQLKNGVVIKGGYAGFGEPDPNARDIELYETILSGDLDGNDVDVNNPADLLDEPTRGENSYHVVTGSGTDTTAVLDGFEIISGNANIRQDRGGGMYNESGSPTIIQCSFSRNSASYGGALYNEESHPIMRGCVFTGNFAYSCGGGIRNRSGSNPTLLNCVFVGNLAGRSWGGGIENVSGSNVTLINCTFKRNAAYRGGGMINLSPSNTVLYNCTFTGNSAMYGGGMCSMDRSNVILINCIFSGNSADENGGGMYCEESCPTTITNCTFSRNSAQEEGGGLYISRPPIPDGGPLSKMGDGTCTITNCIFWENLPQQIVDLNVWSLSSAAYSDVQGGWPGEGSIDADPCFANAGYWDANGTPGDVNDDFWIDGNYHLKSQAGRWEPSSASWVQDAVTSPCIDAGNPMSPIGYEPFPNGGRINMGAYGGTAEASKSYFGTTPCKTVVAGDINGDCKVNFKDFAFMALHWLEDNTPVSAVTTTYLFQPDPNALVTSGGFAGQGQGSRSIEGRFELTIDFDAGIAWFNNVDATLSEEVWIGHNGEGSIFTDSLDVIFNMTELVSTDVSEAAIDFVFEKNIPSFPLADVHLQVIFLDGSVQLVGSVCDAICDGYCFHLDAVAVAEP